MAGSNARHGSPIHRAKGERIVEHMVAGMLADIEALRTAPLPEPVP